MKQRFNPGGWQCLVVITFALILAGCASQQVGTTAGGTWLKDPISGCAVWNSTPSASRESVSWSGGCQNGLANGDGVLVWNEGQRLAGRYVGPMEGGKAQGKGVLDYWIDSGYAHYEGDFHDSEMHGVGTIVLPNGDRATGTCQHDNLTGFVNYKAADGSLYIGGVKDNEPEGKGRQKRVNDEEYFGMFVNGLRQGPGVLLLPNGDIYVGEFQNDLPHGAGKLFTAEGGVYEGPFVNGRPHGEGKFTTPSGDVGRGRVIDGKAQGKFVFTAPNGKTRTEHWSYGVQVKE